MVGVSTIVGVGDGEEGAVGVGISGVAVGSSGDVSGSVSIVVGIGAGVNVGGSATVSPGLGGMGGALSGGGGAGGATGSRSVAGASGVAMLCSSPAGVETSFALSFTMVGSGDAANALVEGVGVGVGRLAATNAELGVG